ncbi:hypothetical protein EZI54_13530 [Marinobacter halodurans]|uniref:Uncharacterized protein n=1 Tax=Marinobacter halodurans TaxID=2528979 RepID=A0ABY1ZIH3_9GAMM|nr:hypothetical protein [Marinobacter halodurans]TBW54435.1 hypothetical protein EZI54_13530 [Marinobacter halodurans]
MFWNFVATVFAGLGAAGLALGIRAATRQKAPRWLIPVFAGAGMLGYLAYNEYTWHTVMQSRLPKGAEVVSEETQRVIWRPWSLIVPQVARFTVLDTNSITRISSDPDVASFYLYQFERTYTDSVKEQVYLLNCTSQELVPVGDDGKANTKALRQLPDSDPLLARVCS